MIVFYSKDHFILSQASFSYDDTVDSSITFFLFEDYEKLYKMPIHSAEDWMLLQKIYTSVRNHEGILRTAIYSKQISTECADSLAFILDLPMTNMDKLQCE